MVTKISDTMDLSQALQTLKWLDQERRKDRAMISKLEERLQEQERRITRKTAQIEELQSALTRLEGRLSKVDEFEQMVNNYKKEMTYQLQHRDETWRKERTEAKRLRRLEHEAMKEHLSRLEKELRVLPRYDEQLNARQAEDERMSEKIQSLEASVADQSKRIEDATNAVAYLEERRRSDHRRLTEAEQSFPKIHKKIDTLAQKFPLLEQSLQKQVPRIDEAIQAARKWEKPIEELRVSDFQREQKMQAYVDQAEEVAEELERVRQQTHGFIERREQVKRALSALEKFRTRIERRQDEMSERQRVAEERIEREWEEWQSERSKELKRRELVIEQRWQAQEEVDNEQVRRVEALEDLIKLHHAQFGSLWETQREDANALLNAAQDVYEQLVAPIDDQLAMLRGDGQE
jgi:DNA repair exonuclease SbcCD ATPase subunit